MPLYSVEFTIYATAYIQADSEDEARQIALDCKDDTMEVSGEWISGHQFDDPELPEFSFSPAMTLGEPDLDSIEMTQEE